MTRTCEPENGRVPKTQKQGRFPMSEAMRSVFMDNHSRDGFEGGRV